MSKKLIYFFSFILVLSLVTGLAQGQSVKVNFQTSTSDTPAGYLPDAGAAFADRGNGFFYGWSRDIGADSRDRNNSVAPDQRWDTLLHLQKGEDAIWEIELENGEYEVYIVCGDAGYSDQTNNLDVEGVILTDLDPQSGNFDEYTTTVVVEDGRLTIMPAPDADNAKICFVDILSLILPTQAVVLNPQDEVIDVQRDVVLAWEPGDNAQTHDVYLATVFEDVNNASRGNPLDALVSEGQSASTYEHEELLEYGQTYYWRIDEYDGTEIHKGLIWSFTIELFAYPITGENIITTASSSEATKGPENAVNGSGLDESGLLHGNVGDNNVWLSSREGEQPTWIEFEFDKIYKLHEMWIWNSNESLEPVIGLGMRDVTIEYSVNGVDYMTLGTTHEFAQAPGLPGYEHNTTLEFNGLAAKYVKLTANSNWGGLLAQYGLSEVRFLQIPIHAKMPVPDYGATGIALELNLSWRAGREAVEHNVYFSDDEQAVIDGTAGFTTVSDTSYGPVSLDLGKTYYWRVDEVNGADVWPGGIWNFTTHEYFIVDDFEDYNDYEPERVFDAWIDGWGIATNGSTIGYPDPDFEGGEHFVETTAVNSGSTQSMPYFYENDSISSEATMTLSSRRDWTEKGASTLTLWFRGNPAGLVEDPNGALTITASGADIWNTADEFRYVYKQLSGPGSIVAKVESVENTDPWAKAGVMIRQTLDADSKYAAVYITPENGCRFQARLMPVANAVSDSDIATPEQTAITTPYWVKIELDASNDLNGYYSSDGVNWVAMAWNPQTTSLPADVYIGLALTSHNVNETCTAVFSNVETTGTVSPQTWAQQAIGVDMPSNEAASMYVALNSTAVVYNDDANASQSDEWTEWNIDLQEFADQGVDLTDVDTFGIGFGDKDNPQQNSGSGLVFFDDIRLYPPLPPEPEPELEPAQEPGI